MKKQLIYILCILLGYSLQAQVVLSDKNYIHITVPQVALTITELESVDCTNITSNDQTIENVTYYDGLGRPIQQRVIKGSPIQKDIVTHIAYDPYGRQNKQYLPFEVSNTPGSYKDINVINDINTYYKTTYAEDFVGIDHTHKDFNAYTENVLEKSPLNRVIKQGAPGKDWKADSISDTDHTIKYEWDTNDTNEVVYFKVSFVANDATQPQLIKGENYPANELYITITKDENWQPGQTHTNDHTTKEYKDKQGRVVLKRTYNQNVAHDTYYVYDDFGNLTYVIPPKVTVGDGVSAIELSELCYQYKYDYRNRLIEKKTPGKGWEYIVYNNLDQPVMTQDANLRKENSGKSWDQWLYTKYDAFGRVAYTGIIIHGATRKVLQQRATAYTGVLWVQRAASTTIGGAAIYYDNGGYPTVNSGQVLTINYYDDYDFLGATPAQPFVAPATVYNEPIVTTTKSLPTATKVKVLSTNNWITTVNWYDKKGRGIYTVSENTYLATTDAIETKLDFTGKVEESKTTHTKGNNAAIVTVDTFEYDHMGRLLTQTQKINTQNPETIVANTYDALGQLQSKTVGGGLQDIAYEYNVRGWLTAINNGDTANGDLFGFKIAYNTPQHGATALYNGNISETQWKTANDNIARHYTYSYDALNRINSAASNDNRYNLSNVTYDKMGNIETLTRNGFQNTSNYTNMDILNYQYGAGNMLEKVTDTGNDTYGFKDGTNTNTDYTYDANGNMLTDQNKGIINIEYNHLNLPRGISIVNSIGKGYITYIYDATGTKLKKIAPEGSSLTETEYAGNYIYKNGNLEFFATAEGYAEPNNSNGFDYIYQYADHLGNIRLSYKDANGNGSITQDEIIEENNYYPFGLKQRGYNEIMSSHRNSTAQKFKYNGIEQEEALGLDLYEMPLRQYDPTIARFTSIDPVTHHSMSTFTAFDNNPVFWADPSGADGERRIQDLNGNWHTINSDDYTTIYESKDNENDGDDDGKNNGVGAWLKAKISAMYGFFTSSEDIANYEGDDQGEIWDERSETNQGQEEYFAETNDALNTYLPWGGAGEGYEQIQEGNYVAGSILILLTTVDFASGGGKGKVGKGIWSSTSKLSSVQNAYGHWLKHGKEFSDFFNARQYVEFANKFMRSVDSKILTKVRKNGDILKYDPVNNIFGVANKAGETRTLFKPTDGIKYWLKQ